MWTKFREQKSFYKPPKLQIYEEKSIIQIFLFHKISSIIYLISWGSIGISIIGVLALNNF